MLTLLHLPSGYAFRLAMLAMMPGWLCWLGGYESYALYLRMLAMKSVWQFWLCWLSCYYGYAALLSMLPILIG
jgi:hypothetical protein